MPGPPKRFAQAIGTALSVAAFVAGPVLGQQLAAVVLLGLIVVAAGLESVFGLCLGCLVFGQLMRHGVIPAKTCEACNDVSVRLAGAQAARAH